MTDTLADTIEKSSRALTASELAKFLSVNKLTIYRQAQAGRLPHFRLGTCIRFDPRVIAAWLRDRGAL